MLKRDISTFSVLMVAAGGMVGSGWLFSPFICAQIAGSNALVSWVLAAFFMWLIALPLCELGTMFPIAGGMTNYPSFTHGRKVGFLFAWTSWLSYVVVTPIEIQAIMQYSGYLFPSLVYQDPAAFELTSIGYIVAISVMLFVVALNSFGIKFLAQCNTYASMVKFIMPSIAVFAFISVSPPFRHIHLDLHHTKSWVEIFSALSAGGIAFAFSGFQNGLMLAGEVQHPQRNIPIAILGSIAVGLILYVALQWGFLVAIPDIALQHGWSHLSFPGHQGPLVGLSVLVGLSWVATLLMIDATISPLGTALVFTAASSRILYGISLNGYLPKSITKLNRYRIPHLALLINLVVGALSFLPFPGWQTMVAFLSSCSILSYGIGPICLLAFRTLQPAMHRPFRMPAAVFLSYLRFYVCNLMLYWCGFEILWKLDVALLLGLVIHYIYRPPSGFFKDISLFWFIGYMGMLSVISYLGAFGGIGYLAFPLDVFCILPISILVLYLSQRVLVECNIPAYLREHLSLPE